MSIEMEMMNQSPLAIEKLLLELLTSCDRLLLCRNALLKAADVSHGGGLLQETLCEMALSAHENSILISNIVTRLDAV